MKVRDLMEATATKKEVTKETKIIRILRDAAREVDPNGWDRFTTTNSKITVRKDDSYEFVTRVSTSGYSYYNTASDDPRLKMFDAIQRSNKRESGWGIIAHEGDKINELPDGRWLIPIALHGGNEKVTDMLLPDDDDDDESIKALRDKMKSRVRIHPKAKSTLDMIRKVKGDYTIVGIKVKDSIFKLDEVKPADLVSNRFEIVMKKVDHEAERKRLMKNAEPTLGQRVVYRGIERLRQSKEFNYIGIRIAKEKSDVFDPKSALDIPMNPGFYIRYIFAGGEEEQKRQALKPGQYYTKLYGVITDAIKDTGADISYFLELDNGPPEENPEDVTLLQPTKLTYALAGTAKNLRAIENAVAEKMKDIPVKMLVKHQTGIPTPSYGYDGRATPALEKLYKDTKWLVFEITKDVK